MQRRKPDRFDLAEKRRKLRRQAIQYKGGCCQICGYDKCDAAMDMHHTESWSKEFTISNRMSSFERIKKELDKTVLLCARCHREVHDGMHPGFLETEASNTGWFREDGEDESECL